MTLLSQLENYILQLEIKVQQLQQQVQALQQLKSKDKKGIESDG